MRTTQEDDSAERLPHFSVLIQLSMSYDQALDMISSHRVSGQGGMLPASPRNRPASGT